MNDKWYNKFISTHGERLTFGGLALCVGTWLYIPNLPPQLETVVVGLMMLCFNKARGRNGDADRNTNIRPVP